MKKEKDFNWNKEEELLISKIVKKERKKERKKRKAKDN